MAALIAHNVAPLTQTFTETVCLSVPAGLQGTDEWRGLQGSCYSRTVKRENYIYILFTEYRERS